MRKTGLDLYRQAVEQSRADGTFKEERIITPP